MHPGKGARVDPIQWICHPVDPFQAEIWVGFLRKAGVAYDPRNLECGLWMGSLREPGPPFGANRLTSRPAPPTEPLFYSRLSSASLIGRLST
jgi:hypothetical protein